MKTAIIWDLDGTLLDSYKIIIKSIEFTYLHYNLCFEREYVEFFIIENSVNALLLEEAKKNLIDPIEFKNFFSYILRNNNSKIKLMKDAEYVLRETKKSGIIHFVITNKGKNSFEILHKLNINQYFEEIVTSDDGFDRKPSPQSTNYLIKKYNLDKKNTFYIGDRKIDVVTAINSEITPILFGNNNINLNTINIINIKSLNELLKCNYLKIN